MDTPFELLDYVAMVLEELGIPYAIGGSIAAMAYGEPRFTRDADVVAALKLGKISEFLDRFPPPDYYVDRTAVRQAVLERSQFNIIHGPSGWKVDIYLPGDWISAQQLARSRRLDTDIGRAANFSPPEELILKKIEFYAQGGSEKHLKDIAAMLARSGDLIDRERIASLARREGLADVWEAMQERLREI